MPKRDQSGQPANNPSESSQQNDRRFDINAFKQKVVEMIVRLDDHCRCLACTYFSMPLPAGQCNSVCVAGGAIANGKDLDSHLNKAAAAAVNCNSSAVVLPPSPGHFDIY